LDSAKKIVKTLLEAPSDITVLRVFNQLESVEGNPEVFKALSRNLRKS
jgi:hypothetical protein